jgi:antitoxin (DNA-binding transcriptional repressor) of toxin-antitoxin stability system
MNYLQFTEFRNKSKKYFSKIKQGNSYVIILKGHPVATVVPFNDKQNGLKRVIAKIKLKRCNNSAKYVMAERNEE